MKQLAWWPQHKKDDGVIWCRWGGVSYLKPADEDKDRQDHRCPSWCRASAPDEDQDGEDGS